MDASLHVLQEFAPIAGGSLYIKRWVPAAAQASARCPIVLLHDSIGCVDMWREFPDALAATVQRPVIAYDRLGYGRSSARHDQPSARFVAEEAETGFGIVKTHLKLGEFALFGHSVGGAMAIEIAARLPGECRAVVTEAAQAFVEPKTLTAIAAGKTRFGNPSELAKLARYHGEKASWVVSAWTDTWLSPEFAAWNLQATLARVKSPLLAIHGDRDEYGSEAFPDALTAWTKGHAERFVVSDCGHVPHRERPDRVLAATEAFFNSCISPPLACNAR